MITWNVLRAAGIGAYLMLWASVAWGLISTTSVFGKKISKATTVALHQAFSTSGLLLLATHLIFLLKDRFMPFTFLDFVIPMRATYRPIGVALGIGSMFVMLLGVLSTSWGRKLIGTKWWRRTHSLSVPAFALALVHGLMTGTDATRPTLFWMYVATAALLLFLLLVRGFTAGERPQRAKLPEGGVRRTQAAVAQRAAASLGIAGEPAQPVEPAERVHRRKAPFAVRPIPVVFVQAEVPPARFRLEGDAAEADELLSEIERDLPVGGNGQPPSDAHSDPARRGISRGHAPRPHPMTRSPDHPRP